MDVARKLAEFHENQGEVIKVCHLKYKHSTPTVHDLKGLYTITFSRVPPPVAPRQSFTVNPFSNPIETNP